MLKALMPVAVYSIGVSLKKESFKTDTMVNMVSISIGVAIAAYGEARFDTWGVILQLGAVAFEATRLVLIQILLTSKGITLNPITSLYYVAPCCLAFLFVPWIFVEYPILRDSSSFHFDFLIFGTNSLCAFALNLAFLACWEDLCFDHEWAAYYNHSKLQALKAKEAQKKTALADEEANRLLEDREGEGIGKRNDPRIDLQVLKLI
ncbi:putative sugar phosphate/phosphate translocator [Prunus yedoensis var. nudiflora]|uniref:Putative sugar phosphate/phosphate translocator n=1 Tax=Prunus yedoensis var. nudiflora TaxID=2094558 RepID=A0A314U675_PRUYE|nr:putative sugar phosphate/phosphate translocator [Prunus yedoensis var. nudiflora]